MASLGFDLPDLASRNLLLVDYVSVERSEIEETGEYDLEGLFIRLSHAIDSIRAKRVVLDTIESLFGGLSNQAILRSEPAQPHPNKHRYRKVPYADIPAVGQRVFEEEDIDIDDYEYDRQTDPIGCKPTQQTQ